MDTVIGFAEAATRSGIWAALWAILTAWAVASLPRRPGAFRDAAFVLVAGIGVALVVDVPQLATYDSTIDFARAKSCVSDACPTLGVYGAYGALEGGVVWIWMLALLTALDDAPRWLGTTFVLMHAFAAAILGLVAPNRRAAFFAGAVYLVVVSGSAAAFVHLHPTYAPMGALPFVLLATRMNESRFADLRFLALGVAFGLAIGVYIAALLLFVMMLPSMLQAYPRQRLLFAAGFVGEQLLVQPHAARHNFEQIDANILMVGIVFALILTAARRWTLAWVDARPWLFGVAAFAATLTFGSLFTGILVQPYYLALAAPLLAGATFDLPHRHRFTFEAILAAAAIGVAGWSVHAYFTRVPLFHEGNYYHADFYDIAPHHRGGYGASVTGPSMLLDYSMPLYARRGPAPDGRGIAYAVPGNSDRLLCDEIIWSQSGQLGICEYETWVQSRGATVCRGEEEPRICRTFDSPEDYEYSILELPFPYRPEEHTELLHFELNVCPRPADGPRTLRPLVLSHIPVRRTVQFDSAPRGGVVSEDRTEVTLSAVDEECVALKFRWDPTRGPTEPWGAHSVKGGALEHLTFMVEERRPDQHVGRSEDQAAR